MKVNGYAVAEYIVIDKMTGLELKDEDFTDFMEDIDYQLNTVHKDCFYRSYEIDIVVTYHDGLKEVYVGYLECEVLEYVPTFMFRERHDPMATFDEVSKNYIIELMRLRMHNRYQSIKRRGDNDFK